MIATRLGHSGSLARAVQDVISQFRIDLSGGMTDSMNMPKVKVAISVGQELFEEIERYSRRHKVSRSEAFARGARKLLLEQQGERTTARADRAFSAARKSGDATAWEKLALAGMAELLKNDQW
jgi:hypothetical protein